jgi:hypothetical protein
MRELCDSMPTEEKAEVSRKVLEGVERKWKMERQARLLMTWMAPNRVARALLQSGRVCFDGAAAELGCYAAHRA